jgi:hypothetical protein
VEGGQIVAALDAGAGVWELGRARGGIHRLEEHEGLAFRDGNWSCFERCDNVGRCGGTWCLDDRVMPGIPPDGSGHSYFGDDLVCDPAQTLALGFATRGHF